MDTIFNWLPEIISGLLGGGLVAIFTIPEKKAKARLDNAERVVSKYEEVLKRYEARISELEIEVKELRAASEQKDHRIAELEKNIALLQRKRNSKGQYIKVEC